MRLPSSLVVLLCLASACAPSGTSARSAKDFRSARRCQVRTVEGKAVTEVVSRRDGYSLLLPGDDWDLHCGRSVALEGTSKGALQANILTVEVADPVDERAFLRWVYSESADDTRKRGLNVSKPSLVVIDEALVLSYEVVGANVDGTDLRIVHAFTARQRPDGTIYTFHVSWVGPAVPFEPKVAPGLRQLATSFHLLPM